MSNKIKHSGIVDSIEDGCMKVRIIQASACAACKAASFCNASDKKEKIIDIYDVASIRGRRVGDEVVIVESGQTGMKAVMLGFGVPFLILVLALVLVSRFTANEPLAALVSIVALIPYYTVIYLLRDKLRDQFSFIVES